MNEKLREFIQERGWKLARITWRPVTHIFRDGKGKSLCGIWQILYGTHVIPGTENPICKRCIRSAEKEMKMARTCDHPKRIITEYLSGKAVHQWKEGTYDYSVEIIERDRIVEECPDCNYRLVLTKGQDMPDDVQERLVEARKMVGTGIDPREVQ